MKKLALGCIISAALLLTSNSTVSAAQTIQFSNSSSKILMSSASSFTELPAKNNVKLDKAWTITFSNNIDMNKIDGILVQKDSDFVPVSIAISGKNTISVKPINSYVPNSKYTLKVFLSSGTKYSMDFTTKNTTDTNDINLYLYGKDGNNKDSIATDHYDYKSVRNITAGLSAGTYYIKVRSDFTLNYSMTIDFSYEASNNDIEPNNNYINAQDLNLNTEITGHIGYTNEDTSNDSADYYKFTLTKDGEVNLNLSHNSGSDINLYLYGKDGDNNDYIASDHYDNKNTRHILATLNKGTYYILVKSDDPTGYTLTTN